MQLVGVGLQRPPVMLRRGGGASMVGERRELLHGLFRERERVGESEGVREGGEECAGVWGPWADMWVPWG